MSNYKIPIKLAKLKMVEPEGLKLKLRNDKMERLKTQTLENPMIFETF